MKRGAALLVGLGAIVLLASSITLYLAERGDLRTATSRARVATAQVRELRGEVKQLREQRRSDDKELTRLQRRVRHARGDAQLWKSAERDSRAMIDEILGVLPAFGVQTSHSCAGSVIGSVRVAILSPRPGEAVSSPVIAHVVGSDPFFCDATLFFTVDGVPYVQLPTEKRGPLTARNPFPMRPRPKLPRKRWTEACISGPYQYLAFDLSPGPHTLGIHDGCPQGTNVPVTIPTSVRFLVH